MRSFSFIVALLFAFVATSAAFPELHLLEARKGSKNGTEKAKNGTSKGNSVNKVCGKMAKLTKLTELANNQTKLDSLMSKGKLNQTEVDKIKAKAANATQTLQTMSSNTTLVQECQVVDAHQKLVGTCKKMKQLTKLADLANNKTAMDAFMAKKKLNDTQVAKLDERIANATTKLKDMQANTTLTSACSQIQQQKGSGNTNAGKYHLS